MKRRGGGREGRRRGGPRMREGWFDGPWDGEGGARSAWSFGRIVLVLSIVCLDGAMILGVGGAVKNYFRVLVLCVL